MFDLVSPETMSAIDRKAIEELGVPSLLLMENAGQEVFQLLRDKTGPLADRTVLVLAGGGNNGGDGLVVARLCAFAGARVSVLMTSTPDRLSPDCGTNLKFLETCHPGIVRLIGENTTADLPGLIAGCSVIVDAVFGTGFKGHLPEPVRSIFRICNNAAAIRVAVDIPSGLCGLTGSAAPDTFRAHYTVTMGLAKPGLFLQPGLDFAGEVFLAGICLPDSSVSGFTTRDFLISRHDIPRLLTKRACSTHKGDYGKVLIVAGSTGMYGAPVLAARGALSAGAGLITLAVPADIEPVIAAKVTEIMTLPLPVDAGRGLACQRIPETGKYTVLTIGPGLGQLPGTVEFIRSICSAAKCPLVIDADAIHALNSQLLLELTAEKTVILTPHTGELAAFCSVPVENINRDRLAFYRDFCEKHGCFLVGKGPNPFLSTPDGRTIMCRVGNPGMAVGGMGDLMTGLIAGFIAEGLNSRTIEESAILAVYFHGFLGDLTAKETGQRPLTPSAMLDNIPLALKELEK
ncbi:MAG: NAD(P)H-hydrate dehydratase [Candidatus Wallbacteria bacterium]|nr:NAD(P)H-hydrate dehydratase [Candidatus Wallbacteria bacterium]